MRYLLFAVAFAMALLVAAGSGAASYLPLNPRPSASVRPGGAATAGGLTVAYGSWTTTATVVGPKKSEPALEGAVWVVVKASVTLNHDMPPEEAACKATLVAAGEQWPATTDPIYKLDLVETSACGRTPDRKPVPTGVAQEVTWYFQVPTDRVAGARLQLLLTDSGTLIEIVP